MLRIDNLKMLFKAFSVCFFKTIGLTLCTSKYLLLLKLFSFKQFKLIFNNLNVSVEVNGSKIKFSNKIKLSLKLEINIG